MVKRIKEITDLFINNESIHHLECKLGRTIISLTRTESLFQTQTFAVGFTAPVTESNETAAKSKKQPSYKG